MEKHYHMLKNMQKVWLIMIKIENISNVKTGDTIITTKTLYGFSGSIPKGSVGIVTRLNPDRIDGVYQGNTDVGVKFIDAKINSKCSECYLTFDMIKVVDPSYATESQKVESLDNRYYSEEILDN